MTLNRLTLIGFVGADAEERTNSKGSPYKRFLGNNEDFMEERGRRVGLQNRIAPLRGQRQDRGFRGHSEEGRSRAGRRRTAQPRVRTQ
jgi:hypothetical protein